MRSILIRVGPKSSDERPSKRQKRRRCRGTLGGKAHEDGSRGRGDAVRSQGCPEATGLGRGRTEPPLEPLRGAWPCPHCDFRVLASRTVEQYIFSVTLSHGGGSNLLGSPWEADAQPQGQSGPALGTCPRAAPSWCPRLWASAWRCTW